MNIAAKTISFLQLIRLPAGCSVISNVLVAHSLATSGNVQPNDLFLTLLASLSLYFGGMVLNDCFDYSEDARDRPERPLPRQQIALKTAWWSGFSLLFLGCLSASWVNMQTGGIAVILALLIVLYNSNQLPPWPSAIIMGLCRYSNWLMALAVVPLSTTLVLFPIPILLYVIALTRLSQLETTSIPIPRLYEVTAILSIALFSLLLLTKITVFSIVVVLILGSYYYTLLLPLTKPHTPEQIQHIVGQFVFGLIPLDAAISLIFGNWQLTIIILLLIPLSQLIGKKLYVS